MMNPFEVCERETEISFMEMTQEIDLRSRLYMINEVGGIASLVDSIIQKIKEIFDNIKSRIQEYFTGEEYDKSVSKLESILKKNPLARDKKVKVKETGKLRGLFRETVDKIRRAKNADEIEDAMNKYKKQRNILLAAGAGILITGSALLIMARKHSKDEIKNLSEDNKRLVENIRKYKEEGYQGDIKDRDAVYDGIVGVERVATDSLKKLSELAKEYSKDALKEIAYNLHVIKEFNKLVEENIE